MKAIFAVLLTASICLAQDKIKVNVEVPVGPSPQAQYLPTRAESCCPKPPPQAVPQTILVPQAVPVPAKKLMLVPQPNRVEVIPAHDEVIPERTVVIPAKTVRIPAKTIETPQEPVLTEVDACEVPTRAVLVVPQRRFTVIAGGTVAEVPGDAVIGVQMGLLGLRKFEHHADGSTTTHGPLGFTRKRP